MANKCSWQAWLWQNLRAAASTALHWIYLAVHWKFSLPIAVILAVIAASVAYVAAYRKWRSGWLSHQIDIALRNVRKQKSRSWRVLLPAALNIRHVVWALIHYCFVGTRAALRYFVTDYRRILHRLYLPTFMSCLLLAGLVAVVLLWSHWPQHLNLLWHPLQWPSAIVTAITDKDEAEGVSHVFESLVVLVIALIVFVAESIRSSHSADEKRVLLKISKLWILVVLISFAPLAFIYLPLTELSIVLAIAITLLTLWGFAQALLNLLDPDRSVKEQRAFLKERVHDIVLQSARQRVGNRILFDRFKRDGANGMEVAFSRSFLPGKKKNYVFVRAPQAGIIDDINVAGLERLGRFLSGQEEQSRDVAAASMATDITSGPSTTAPQAAAKKAAPRSFLLRRFREAISVDPTFSSDADILAIPKAVAERKGVMDEVNGVVGTMFRFTKSEPPSSAFRREMRSTKDRLLHFIQAGALGEVEELRDSYRLVADEFLTTLNELGGGYSAEQARKERNDWFGSWDEVRWLVSDVRDILKAAADTKNADVVQLILILPYSIAIRAFQAGDNLLFQEFLSFASYIYVLGFGQDASSETRSLLIDRSHKYLHDLLAYFIEPAMTEDGDDGD